MEFMAVPAQERMLLDLNDTVAVTGRPAVAARLALAGKADPYIIVDTGRNRHPTLNGDLSESLADTIAALVLDDLAGTTAGRAGGLQTKNTGGLKDLPLTTAVFAGLG
jgi:hypothetical protein